MKVTNRRMRVAQATRTRLPVAVALTYERGLKRIFDQVLKYLTAHATIHQDGKLSRAAASVTQAVVGYVRNAVGKLFDTVSALVRKVMVKAPGTDQGLDFKTMAFRDESVQLAVDATFEVADGVMSTEMYEARATMLGGDQTHKYSQLVVKTLAVNGGSPGYIWTTMHDNRVRDTHISNDGKFFRWDEVAPNGTVAPGYEVNCRCVGLPTT